MHIAKAAAKLCKLPRPKAQRSGPQLCESQQARIAPSSAKSTRSGPSMISIVRRNGSLIGYLA
jgi:hypothetical protein